MVYIVYKDLQEILLSPGRGQLIHNVHSGCTQNFTADVSPHIYCVQCVTVRQGPYIGGRGETEDDLGVNTLCPHLLLFSQHHCPRDGRKHLK